MIFSELYGSRLDQALGTSDRDQRFKTVRRKASINLAQQAWNTRTQSIVKRTTIALVDGTQEYDLETSITDFVQLADQGVSIKIVSGSNTRYLEGDDLRVTTIARLNAEEPGWRAVAASTPTKVYQTRDGGAFYLGFYPPPDITGSDVWTAIIPYLPVIPEMVDDDDEPFDLTGANPLKSMRPWHQALVHWAAYDLEDLRKDDARKAKQFQLFEAEVAKFAGLEKPKGGQAVRFARTYRQRRPTGWRLDPRIV